MGERQLNSEGAVQYKIQRGLCNTKFRVNSVLDTSAIQSVSAVAFFSRSHCRTLAAVFLSVA